MTAPWRPISLLASVLLAAVAWLAPMPSAVAVPETWVVSVYTYDAPVYDAHENYTAPERGPPLRVYADTTYDAADRSHGTSARSAGLSTPTNATHATRVVPAPAAAATTTTGSQVVVAVGVLSLLDRWQVAAKTRKIDNVDDLPCNCFVAGTKVQTADGEEPIEDVEVGDQVWAKDLTSGSSELRTVTALFQKQADSVMTIRVSSGTEVTVTDEHPFYVAGEGWVMSGDLRVGDELDQRDGGTTVIRAIDVAPTNATVYNFTVEGDHNYYVTDAQLLVHNCSWVNLTTKGSRTRNVGTDLTDTEFAANMTAAGWSSTFHPSGHQIFTRGGAKYVLRDKARDYAGWTAEFTPAGATRSTLKIRLGYPP